MKDSKQLPQAANACPTPSACMFLSMLGMTLTSRVNLTQSGPIWGISAVMGEQWAQCKGLPLGGFRVGGRSSEGAGRTPVNGQAFGATHSSGLVGGMCLVAGVPQGHKDHTKPWYFPTST